MKKWIIVLIIISLSGNLLAQKFDNLAQTPPMGWSSWNKFGREINEDIIRRMADAMVETGLKDVGYEYINLDDTWQIDRDEEGNILVDSTRFPSGIKALADYVHSKGLKFGIYSCAGVKTCCGHPGSRGYEFQDARTYASWGVDYLKYDFCYADIDGQSTTASYKLMRDALYKAGRPIVFSICEWGTTKPWLWAKDIGHLYRTTIDITDCSKCLLVTGARGWLNILDESAPIWKYNGPGHWNDPDMLEVGNGGLTPLENKSHFVMWCMLSAPLMLGNDLENMTPDVLEILKNKELIAIDQDPLGQSAYRYIQDEEIEVWIKQLENDRWAMAVLNTSETEQDFHLEWNLMYMTRVFQKEFNAADSYKLYDVWNNKDVGTTAKPLSGKLEGRDVLLLLLSRE